MGERTEAQVWASCAFRDAKRMRGACEPHSKAGRIARARMRNAWVAYHAGAPWMTRADEVDYLVEQCQRKNADCEHYANERRDALQEAARLNAEVARLRSEKPRLDEFSVKNPFGHPMVAGTLRHNAYAKGWEHGALDHTAAAAFYDAVRSAGVLDYYENGFRSGKAARGRAWQRAALAREDGAG